jgi:hypothetical protein
MNIHESQQYPNESDTSAAAYFDKDSNILAAPAETQALAREWLEAQLSSSIDTALASHSKSVITSPDGTKSLSLFVVDRESYSPRYAEARITESPLKDAAGSITTLSFTGKGSLSSYWQLARQPGEKPRLVPCRFDKESGSITPIQPPEDESKRGTSADQTSDAYVFHFGKLWLRNLEQGVTRQSRTKRAAHLVKRVTHNGLINGF